MTSEETFSSKNSKDLLQPLRDRFADALANDDAVLVEKMLIEEPSLANVDLRKRKTATSSQMDWLSIEPAGRTTRPSPRSS